MTNESLEERVATLEAELEQVKDQLGTRSQPTTPWWEKIFGTFADSDAHEEAVRLGREYREALRPKDDEENCV